MNKVNVKKYAATKEASAANERLIRASLYPEDELLEGYKTGDNGLDESAVEKSASEFGRNVITVGKKNPVARRLVSAFVNPFTIVLMILAGISVLTDIVFAETEDRASRPSLLSR